MLELRVFKLGTFAEFQLLSILLIKVVRNWLVFTSLDF